MRKFVFSLFLILVYALNFAGLNIKSAAAQDSLELVCSAPADGAELDYLPETVVLRFSADLAEGTAVFVADEATSARVDISGSLVVEGAIATVGVDASSDPDSEGGDADTAYLEAGKAYEVFVVTKVDGKATRFTVTFSIAEGATEVQPMAMKNDCVDGDVNGDGVEDNAAIMPTEEATEEATAEATEEVTEEPTVEATEETTAEPTEEVTVEATEEATAEPTEEATEEPTEVATEEATVEATEEATAEPTEEVTAEATEEATAEPTEEATVEATESTLAEPQPYTAGTVNFTVSAPAGYAVKTDENFFVLPVVVAAADEATVDAYLANPDAVQGFAVIFTTFTSADLASFGLAAEATPADIIAALVRADSTPSEPAEATVAGAPALKVDFTNATSGKSGTFYLVSFEGGNYLLIQGSAATTDWPNYTATFEEVVAAIAVAAE